MPRKKIAILGSTGSIGVNALDVAARHQDRFEVVLLTAFNNVDRIGEQIHSFRPEMVAIAPQHISRMQRQFPKVRFFDVTCDVPKLVEQKNVDAVVLATTGAAALAPFLSAVRAGKTVAPANKEALVMAGDLIMAEARKHKARVIPIDSEQSAIFQALQGHRREDLQYVHLTASGGPLLHVPRSGHDLLTVKDILRHPRWKMGAKITVDSATLMNKGFEVIEALRLFDLRIDQVKVVVHPEALVHSLVEYKDGSMIAQISATDMRIPIQYALTWPEHCPSGLKGFDLAAMAALTFLRPDLKKFPSLALAFDVARLGGTAPAVLNAADEIAVNAFLEKKLSFTGMYRLTEKVVRRHHVVQRPSLKDIEQADAWAREQAAIALERTK